MALSPSQSEKAKRFVALHHGPHVLVLPNAWDVASARIFEETGFPAIATTSAGIANSLGYEDGQKIPRDEMLEAVARIAHAVSVPVTADLESGYGETPETAAETAWLAIEAGAVGMNFEDCPFEGAGKLFDVSRQQAKIRAIVDGAKRAGIDFVLNARSDVFLEGLGQASERPRMIIERLNAYREAGASCFFAPGVNDASTIAQIAREVRGPVNILATVGTPSVTELEKLGVARVSVGSGPMRATLGLLSRVAKQLHNEGRFDLMLGGALTYAQANDLFTKR